MVDLLLAGAAVVLLVVVTVVLMRRERLGRGRLAGAIALIVLAAGTFAVTLYRSQTEKSDKRGGLGWAASAGAGAASSCAPATTSGAAAGGGVSCRSAAGDPAASASGGAASGPASSGPTGAGGPSGAGGSTPAAGATAAGGAATPGAGTVVRTVRVPMGKGDKLPQGALWLDPPRPGTDPYTGDVSLMCVSPGKNEHEQNCTGADERTWVIQPIEHRVTLGFAKGDPFVTAAACEPANGVTFVDDYFTLEADQRYCLLRPDGSRAYALRVLTFPKEKPVPVRLTVEVAVLG